MPKTYECRCCNCGHEFLAQKSIFHDMGFFDLGRAECPKCNTVLNLIYNPENDSMTVRLHEDLINEIKNKEEN